MATLNIPKIKEEILNLIRNNDILTITQRNVLTTTDNFTATVGQTDFTLTNPSVKNIRSVVVDSTTLDLYADYDINIEGKDRIESKLVTLNSALTGGESVDITYDYSKGIDPKTGKDYADRVWSDFPEDFVKIGGFPRVVFDIVSIANTNRSSNDTVQQKSILFSFGAFADNKTVESLQKTYYDLIFANRKNRYWLTLLRPDSRDGKESYKKVNSTLIYSMLFSYEAPAQFEK